MKLSYFAYSGGTNRTIKYAKWTGTEWVKETVDSSEGPLPQTRFVLKKALDASLPILVADNFALLKAP